MGGVLAKYWSGFSKQSCHCTKMPIQKTDLYYPSDEELQNNIATYRCAICYQNDDEIDDMYDKYPKLKNHLVSIENYNNQITINYMACDNCIDNNEKFLFVHYPYGWENDHKFKYEKTNIVLAPIFMTR